MRTISSHTRLEASSHTRRMLTSLWPWEQKTESAGVGRDVAESQKVDVDCLKPSWVSDFNRTDFSLRPFGVEGIERHLVIPSTTLSVVGIFSRPIFLEMT